MSAFPKYFFHTCRPLNSGKYFLRLSTIPSNEFLPCTAKLCFFAIALEVQRNSIEQREQVYRGSFRCLKLDIILVKFLQKMSTLALKILELYHKNRIFQTHFVTLGGDVGEVNTLLRLTLRSGVRL